MTRVACIGECMIELKQADGGLYSRGYGGDTLNTAVYLARLGAGVDYITALGDNSLSDEMIAGWAAEGVGTTRVLRLPGKLPGIYMIQTDEKGERRFFHWRDNSAARSLMDLPDTSDILRSLMSYDVVYLSAITLSLYNAAGQARLFEALERARANGRARCLRYQFSRARLARSGCCARGLSGCLRNCRHRSGLDRGFAAALSRRRP